MIFFLIVLASIACITDARLTSRNNATVTSPASSASNNTRYAILDNDWGSTGFIPYLLALGAGMEVLGLASDTANTWVDQTTLHGLAILERGNLSCIPVVKGETYPLVQTYQRFQIWQQLWGSLLWQGVFAPENLTAQSLGNDPTGDNPSQISKSAFIEGYPNTTALEGYTAAQFMVEQVHKYPGQVSIYSAGSLTNIALATRLDSTFASSAKELVIMGGYVDLNLYQLQSPLAEDIGSDINFLVDPEAAHIAVTAPFPSITVAGNVANQQYLSQSMLDGITASDNAYAQLMSNYDISLPMWDETAAAIMAFPDLVTNQVKAYMDVNTAFDSPDLARTHLWSKQFAPSHTREVNYVLGINQTAFFERVEQVLIKPPSCP
ncbi:Inosine/uridine-preferring nucleoside hydrolase domain-containing protein [Usnea florida]